MSSYFITATGTGIGKTYISASLAKQWPNLQVLKPIISGYSESEETDTHILLKAQNKKDPNEISPWRFAAPLSPDAAARREGREIVFEELIEWCREQMLNSQATLIEGAGGIMTPVNERHTMLDWMAALRVPVILVAGSYLGTISHTLSSLVALKARNVPVHKVVINESIESPMPLEETAETIERFSGLSPLIVKRNQSVPLNVLTSGL